MAIALALLAGLSNALATVFQRIAVEAAPEGHTSTKTLLSTVLKRPIWLAGLGLMTVSFLLQALALSVGNLSTVQPVMVFELVFLLAVLAVWLRRPLGWREWFGASGTAAGLGLFLWASAPGGGQLRPTLGGWTLVLIAAVGGIVLSIAFAQKGGRSWRAAWYGVASGIAFAMTAGFLKVSSSYASSGGFARLPLHWQTYGVAVAGATGLILVQHALHAGPIAASQSASLIVGPIAAILIGVGLFGDRLHTAGARLALSVLGLVTMCAGLFVLAHSPLITASAEDEALSNGGATPGVAGGFR